MIMLTLGVATKANGMESETEDCFVNINGMWDAWAKGKCQFPNFKNLLICNSMHALRPSCDKIDIVRAFWIEWNNNVQISKCLLLTNLNVCETIWLNNHLF